VIPLLPPDRCLVETDTPYLAPVPHRGKPNRPGYVVEIAERLARETGETYEQVCRRTGENFFRLFAKAVEPKPRRILGQDEGLFEVPDDFDEPFPFPV
jgi:TatD DNase family protein